MKFSFDIKKLHELVEFEPNDAQKDMFLYDARFKVYVCGRRWGKSLAAAHWALPYVLKPGSKGWVVSKTYDLTMKVIREMRVKLKKYILSPSGKDWKRIQVSGPVILELPWGSTIEGKSAEHPDSLLGEGIDWLVFDECAKSSSIIWEQYLRPTLTDREGDALFITTPHGYNWIYDLWKRGQGNNKYWKSYQFPSDTNPHLSKADIEEARRVIDNVLFEQEYMARFTFTSGRVYNSFDELIHVIPPENALKHDWPKFRSIDFGYENPFVCLYIAVDPEDRVIIYDEYYQRHKSIEQHAKVLNNDNQEYIYTTCDPSGASQRASLRECGIPTIGVRGSVDGGISLVRQLLDVRDDGIPGLMITSNCVETIREFNLYCYSDSNSGETPKKVDDHAMDALRYFLTNWKRGYIKQYSAV